MANDVGPAKEVLRGEVLTWQQEMRRLAGKAFVSHADVAVCQCTSCRFHRDGAPIRMGSDGRIVVDE